MKQNHSVTVAGMLVTLTGDGTYDYNDQVYAIELTNVAESENDADVSGLEVTASALEIKTFLDAAAATVQDLVGPDKSVKNVSSLAARAGMQAVAALREGTTRRSAVLTLPQ